MGLARCLAPAPIAPFLGEAAGRVLGGENVSFVPSSHLGFAAARSAAVVSATPWSSSSRSIEGAEGSWIARDAVRSPMR